MTFVTVFRRAPRPIIGMIGILRDPTFEAFEATLDWLETTGVLVERFDPAAVPSEVVKRPAVQQILASEADGCLPLILIDESIASSGLYLSRSQLARVVGQGRRAERAAA